MTSKFSDSNLSKTGIFKTTEVKTLKVLLIENNADDGVLIREHLNRFEGGTVRVVQTSCLQDTLALKSDQSFDILWSQDALMYGADKRRILEEVDRVLKPRGVLDFTDILADRDLDAEDRRRLYERVRTPEMWDTERYLTALIELGFKIRRVEDWSEHVAASYSWARDQAKAKREELESKVGADLVQRTMDGLEFWVDMAERGNVGWALIVAQKPG